MSSPVATADDLIGTHEGLRSDGELANVRKRLAPDEAAFGIRVSDLFATAKAKTDLALDEVERLLDYPPYEPRMAAMCILDFKARRLSDDARRALYELYVRRHDRITTWDMVDRSAPPGGGRLPRSTDAIQGDQCCPSIAHARSDRRRLLTPVGFTRGLVRLRSRSPLRVATAGCLGRCVRTCFVRGRSCGPGRCASHASAVDRNTSAPDAVRLLQGAT